MLARSKPTSTVPTYARWWQDSRSRRVMIERAQLLSLLQPNQVRLSIAKRKIACLRPAVDPGQISQAHSHVDHARLQEKLPKRSTRQPRHSWHRTWKHLTQASEQPQCTRFLETSVMNAYLESTPSPLRQQYKAEVYYQMKDKERSWFIRNNKRKVNACASALMNQNQPQKRAGL